MFTSCYIFPFVLRFSSTVVLTLFCYLLYIFEHFPIFCYSMMASFSEGLLLSEKVGLDPKVLVEVASHLFLRQLCIFSLLYVMLVAQYFVLILVKTLTLVFSRSNHGIAGRLTGRY